MQKHGSKNEYRIDGNTAILLLAKTSGEIIETIIDLEDLEKVLSYPNRWCVRGKKSRWYVYANTPTVNGKRSTIELHRFLMDAPSDMVVDHINHNTLDNRKSNLRIVTSAQNNQNRKGCHSDNKYSRLRNVHWHKGLSKWRVRIIANGKTHYIGAYDDLEQAKEVAIRERKRLLPFSYDEIG